MTDNYQGDPGRGRVKPLIDPTYDRLASIIPDGSEVVWVLNKPDGMEGRGFVWSLTHIEDILGVREEDDGEPFSGMFFFLAPNPDPEQVARDVLEERKVSPDASVLTMDVTTLLELLTTAARRGAPK